MIIHWKPYKNASKGINNNCTSCINNFHIIKLRILKQTSYLWSACGLGANIGVLGTNSPSSSPVTVSSEHTQKASGGPLWYDGHAWTYRLQVPEVDKGQGAMVGSMGVNISVHNHQKLIFITIPRSRVISSIVSILKTSLI